MALIRIDYDGLSAQATKLNTIRENYVGLSSRLHAMIDQIKDGWEGEASVAYYEKMSNYHSKSLKMSNLFDEFRDYTNFVATEFQATDNRCADLISKSF